MSEEWDIVKWRSLIAQRIMVRMCDKFGLKRGVAALEPILVALHEELNGWNNTPSPEEEDLLVEDGSPIQGFPKLSHVIRQLREGKPIRYVIDIQN